MQKTKEPLIEIGTKFPSKTYKKFTACGNLYITIVTNLDSKVEFIRISGNTKELDCGASFFETLSDMITFSVRRIRNQYEADSIIKNLRYHRCNKIVPNKEHIVSCSDAIGQVLQSVIGKNENQNQENIKNITQ